MTEEDKENLDETAELSDMEESRQNQDEAIELSDDELDQVAGGFFTQHGSASEVRDKVGSPNASRVKKKIADSWELPSMESDR